MGLELLLAVDLPAPLEGSLAEGIRTRVFFGCLLVCLFSLLLFFIYLFMLYCFYADIYALFSHGFFFFLSQRQMMYFFFSFPFLSVLISSKSHVMIPACT